MQGLAGRLNFTASATSHNASYTDPSLANVNATETDGEQLDASDPRNRFSYAVRKMRFVWKDVAPLLRLAGPGMYLATYIGALLGILLSVYHTWNGIRSSWATYFRAYEMLQTHRQTALRFPLRKANSMRLLSTLVFYHIFGFALTTLIHWSLARVRPGKAEHFRTLRRDLGRWPAPTPPRSLTGRRAGYPLSRPEGERSLAPRLGRFIGGLLVAETWLPGEAVRTWLTHSVVLTIVEMFYVRGVVTPFFQYAPFPSGGSMLPPRVCPPLPGLPGAYPVYRPMVWRWL